MIGAVYISSWIIKKQETIKNKINNMKKKVKINQTIKGKKIDSSDISTISSKFNKFEDCIFIVGGWYFNNRIPYQGPEYTFCNDTFLNFVFNNCEFKNCKFEGIREEKISFICCTFIECDFKLCNMSDLLFKGCIFKEKFSIL